MVRGLEGIVFKASKPNGGLKEKYIVGAYNRSNKDSMGVDGR